MVELGSKDVDIKRKCELLNVARSSMYYEPKEDKSDDALIMNKIRNIYQETPFYGYRQITIALRKMNYVVNHKKVFRLMRLANIEAIYPAKKTMLKNPEHKVFPYLLRDLIIE
jgi:putative transposase